MYRISLYHCHNFSLHLELFLFVFIKTLVFKKGRIKDPSSSGIKHRSEGGKGNSRETKRRLS